MEDPTDPRVVSIDPAIAIRDSLRTHMSGAETPDAMIIRPSTGKQ